MISRARHFLLIAGLAVLALPPGVAEAKHAKVELHLAKKGFTQIQVVECNRRKCEWQARVKSPRDGWTYRCRDGEAKVRRRVRISCRYRVPKLSPVENRAHRLPIGFNDSWTQTPDLLEASGEAGGQFVRFGLNWATVNPRPRKYKWKVVDRVFARALVTGQVIVPVVLNAPCWAATFCADPQRAAPPKPKHYVSYGKFLVRLIKRYTYERDLPLIGAIELWNEPNSPKYWLDDTPKDRDDSAGDYAKLIRIATREVAAKIPRDRRPALLVGSPALNSPQYGYTTLNNAHLKKVYATNSHRRTNGQAIHPFSRLGPQENYIDDTRRLISEAKATIAKAGVRGIPFWISEFGFSTHPRAPVPYTEAEKATAIVDVLDLLARTPGIEMAMIHRFVDRPDETEHGTSWFEDGMGVGRLDSGGQYRPHQAYCAVAAWSGTTPELCE